MAILNFIPTVWAGGIMRELELNQTWTQAGVVNRDYEGQIKNQGDRVQINQLGDVSIFDYEKNTNLPDPEILDDSKKTLVIDQQKAFHFYVDDIDQVQSSEPLIGEATRKASRGLNEVAGGFVGNLALGADNRNVLGSANSPITTIDKQNVYDFLVEMAKRLNDAGVPKDGRWIQAPSWLESIMLTAKILTDVDPQGFIRNGVIGKVATFNVISAPLVPTATGTGGASDVVVAGHSMAISFAEQIVDVKAYEPEKRFGDAVKGLHVYGGKLIRPEAVSIAYAKGSSGAFANA